MRPTPRLLTRLLLAATLMLSAPPLSGCATRTPQPVTVIPADRMIRPLDNGNYEVTPAWLQERYRLERRQAERLKECGK